MSEEMKGGYVLECRLIRDDEVDMIAEEGTHDEGEYTSGEGEH